MAPHACLCRCDHCCVGQLVGAIFFGSLAEKVEKCCLLPFYCLWQWTFPVVERNVAVNFPFLTRCGNRVPVASAYINEFIGAEKRVSCSMKFCSHSVLCLQAWFPDANLWLESHVYCGPNSLVIPLRFFLPESPRWLAFVLKKQIKWLKALKTVPS